ncbi:MAG: NYN domain-containing protein [Chloroflexi bacterium]|nr:NYN domain-containing protein [Chloroflexota bacterium]
MLVTNVYIDGFNLYYRALNGTSFKWLDVERLAKLLFPRDQINQVCYFTARIAPRRGDPSQPQRQQAYLRALATLPNIEFHFGKFRPRRIWRPLVSPVRGLPRVVEVHDSEEKGSDVNLATRLLVDGFTAEYEQAVVISNDADFSSPMKYVRDELGLRVALVNPDPNVPIPSTLMKSATYVKQLRKTHLRQSQFAAQITDQDGVITKPRFW